MTEMQFESIVAAMPDAVVITEASGVILFVNAAARDLFGKPEQELVGAAIGFSVKPGEVSDIEVRRGDERRTAEMRVVGCEWGGRNALLATIRDNTDRDQSGERLRHAQKMEAIGLLAGGVAHDFNNLLLVMLIYAEMIRAECAENDPRSSDILEVIRAIERAQALTRQLLACSRRLPAQPSLINLNEVVTGLHAGLRDMLPANIEIEVRLADQPSAVRADRSELEQAIVNLVVNAKDAMPDGGHLLVEIENRRNSASDPSTPHADRVALRVTDSGGGIESAHLSRIFEPYFNTKELGRGVALGLAASYGIVTQAGGTIVAESDLGRGTTFTVLLPRAPDLSPEKTAGATEIRGYEGRETILVVEDDVAVMRATTNILQTHGYTVMTATNGEEACRVLARESDNIHLVLSDMVMPQLSGPDLETIVADKWPRMPLIFMTGYSEQPVVHQDNGIRIKNRPALMKPFRARALLRTLRETLDATGNAMAATGTPTTQ